MVKLSLKTLALLSAIINTSSISVFGSEQDSFFTQENGGIIFHESTYKACLSKINVAIDGQVKVSDEYKMLETIMSHSLGQVRITSSKKRTSPSEQEELDADSTNRNLNTFKSHYGEYLTKAAIENNESILRYLYPGIGNGWATQELLSSLLDKNESFDTTLFNIILEDFTQNVISSNQILRIINELNYSSHSGVNYFDKFFKQVLDLLNQRKIEFLRVEELIFSSELDHSSSDGARPTIPTFSIKLEEFSPGMRRNAFMIPHMNSFFVKVAEASEELPDSTYAASVFKRIPLLNMDRSLISSLKTAGINDLYYTFILAQMLTGAPETQEVDFVRNLAQDLAIDILPFVKKRHKKDNDISQETINILTMDRNSK